MKIILHTQKEDLKFLDVDELEYFYGSGVFCPNILYIKIIYTKYNFFVRL